MAIPLYRTPIPFLLVMLLSVSCKEHLESPPYVETLMRIKDLLNSPPSLSSWEKGMDFCNSEPTPTLTVVCYDKTITQLHIVGDLGAPRLPINFSIDSFTAALVKLPSLKVLTLVSLGLWGPLPTKFMRLSSLEILNLTSNFFQGQIPPVISSLQHLQTLILERNNFTGRLPDSLGLLSSLAVLNVKNNSLYGSLPHSLGDLENLRVLVLSNNNFSGDAPDLSSLTNLQVIDLENNALGPRFPVVGQKIEHIALRNNRFTFGIPEKVQSYHHLKFFDISLNRFVGPFPVSLLSLPSVAYINIAENRLTGLLSESLPCSDDLYYLNLTANLLTGKLPRCLLSDSSKRVAVYAENCLETGDGNQQPVSFCKNEALAVGILPRSRKQKQASKVILALSICAGVTVGVLLVSACYFVVRNFLSKRAAHKSLTRFTEDNASSTVYTSKILKDARYITQAMKIGALGLPSYRTFSLEELEEATNNFHTSTSIGEGSHGQMYRGQLRDGSYVAIRCLKLKRNHRTQNFMPQIELISKLRHQNLVSALGHCLEYYLDDSSVSRVFLVFAYVSNGTLRSWISAERRKQKLTWGQRVAAATGVAKGIQFLHTGIVPGLFANNIKITDILMDHNLVAKISSYNLPLISENIEKERLQNVFGGSKDTKRTRAMHQDKLDIYDFGVILLQLITGKPINSRNEEDAVKDQLNASTIDDVSRRSLVDPAVRNTCSGESVRTMTGICSRCLLEDPAERPSIEDVIWNLQFAAQVQDGWRGDSQSSEGSPISPLQSLRVKPTIASRA